MKTFIFLLFAYFHLNIVNAQSLAIGDHVPDVQLNHLLNYKSSTARLKDFNRKCLILDFWNTYCGTCVEAFPKMEKFQKLFAGKLQVLLVNTQTEEKVRNFFEKKRLTQGVVTSLSSYNNDKILSRLFLHAYEPHYAWIDPEGKVYAITGASEMNEYNLDAFIKGIPSVMRQKNDAEISYEYNKPFLVNGNGGDGSSFLYHSILSGYIDKLLPTLTVDCDKKYGYTIRFINLDILSLFQKVYDKGEYDGGLGKIGINNNQTILELPDSLVICKGYPSQDGGKNMYCYELIAPPVKDPAALKDLAKADLDRYFNIRAHIEKRKIPCWVLQSDDTAFISSKGGSQIADIEYFSVKMRNSNFSNLIFYLQHDYMARISCPLIDETGIKGPVDLEFKADMTSPESLNTALLSYKMRFIKEDRWIDMLILQQAQTSN
jgi:thiol-disulfide isomerase/thioredoxin